ncbi:chloride channel protein [Parafilimonas sp.]|uniref:chloride channel protein n=1 Tax=Parafilimonas sp. TaxID=1969739 RepID=UPI003F822FDC
MKDFFRKIYTNIRLKLKGAFDAISNENIKSNILQAVPFWIASIITGLIAVLYTKMFAFAESIRGWLFDTHAWLFFIITPVCFIISWWVVAKFSPYAKGSGIPQVMAAIELSTPRYNSKIKKMLSIPVIFVKIISSLIMTLGGGIIGREGPTIQIAGSIFRKVNEWLPAWYPKISKRIMIMTGAAAGLAAAFNTPLGGIVFAIEELTKTHLSYFKTAIFTAVIIAGLTAQGFLGSYLYLGYPQINALSWWIFSLVIVVGAVAGFLGAYSSRIVLLIQKWKSTFKFQYQHVLYLVFCALLIASFAFFFSADAIGSGKDLMVKALFTSEKYTTWYMPVLRITGTIFSFTAGGAGGIFAPALSAGASIGSLVSGWFNLNGSDANIIILCGMVSFLTGVTRSPFTCAILVLEMTDRNNLIFHLMFAGLVASIASLLVDKHSLYHHLKDQYQHELMHEDDAKPQQTTSDAKQGDAQKNE